jgi:replicative DNA helicase
MGFLTFSQALTGAVEAAGEAYKTDGFVPGLATGLANLDAKLGGLNAGELTIIAGRPNMGKSALAATIAVNAARAGNAVAYFSLETKAKRLANRILAGQVLIPTDRISRGMIDESEFKRLVEVTQELRDIPLFTDDTAQITIADIAERTRELKKTRRGDLDLVVVDYIQLMSPGERQGEGRYQEISEVTAGLKALAMALNIPVVATSQLSRAVESRDGAKIPVLTDLLGSGSIEHDADVVLLLYREEAYLERAKPAEGTMAFQDWLTLMQSVAGVANVIVAKNRHGPIGTAWLSFDAQLARFSDRASTSSR